MKEYVSKNSNCTLLSNRYVNQDTELEFICGCGENFCMTFRNFKRNQSKCCRKCLGNYISSYKALPYDYVKYIIEIESKSGCKLLSKEYKKSSSKLKIQCKCGNIFYTTFNAFNNIKKPKQQCNKCSNIINWNLELIEEYIKNNSEVEFLNKNEELKYMSVLKLRCPCGNIYEQKFNKFLLAKHKYCEKCVIQRRSQNNRNSYDEIKQNIESIEGYKLISNNYNGYRDKLEIQCPEGHIFKMSYKNFYYESCRCLVCNESIGVRIIKNWLDKNNIYYQQEFSFSDCCNLLPLLFDFVIFKDSKILCLIEYDGQYHYLPINGKSRLIYQQINDSIKNTYCKTNNIKLIRIPYWENDNIENILEEQLNEL